MSATPDQLLVAVEDGVGRLTFDNAERRNALTLDMARALPAILGALDGDPEVRAIVVTGAGDAAFMSGADIRELDDPALAAGHRAAAEHMLAAFAAVGTPLIAMIRGYCLGAGLAVALLADVRFASEDGAFGIPAARLGLGYTYPEVRRLVSLVGPASAADMLFTARRLPAAEALAIGLVQQVCPGPELERRVAEHARMIAANAPLTVRAAKAAIRAAQAAPGEADVAAVERLVEACAASEDIVEGRQAFLSKRAPRFRGR